MRLLFLTHAPDTPSTRYRVLPHLEPLRRAGHDVARADLPAGLLARWRLFRHAAAYDVVVHQKRLLPTWQVRILRRHAKRLVYDFDDPMPYARTGERVRLSATRVARFRAILGAADAVVAHHAGLAELARRHGARVIHVLPTPVDLSAWRPRESWSSERPVFGWIGTRSNLPLLRTVAAALRGRRLRIVADASVDLPGVEVEFDAWNAARESEQVRGFDVGLAPLGDDDWSRWKLPYKILDYFAAGVPVVSSRQGAVASVICDGENGLLAGDWSDALGRLERDAPLRERLGRAGRMTVESRFSLATSADRLRALLESLA